MAPEVLLHQRLTRAADVYSYGILVRFGECGGGGGLCACSSQGVCTQQWACACIGAIHLSQDL